MSMLYLFLVLCSTDYAAEHHCPTHVRTTTFPYKCRSKIDLAVV